MVYVMATMSIVECRAKLGRLNERLTDKQVEKIRDNLIQIAYFGLQRAKEEWKQQKSLSIVECLAESK